MDDDLYLDLGLLAEAEDPGPAELPGGEKGEAPPTKLGAPKKRKPKAPGDPGADPGGPGEDDPEPPAPGTGEEPTGVPGDGTEDDGLPAEGGEDDGEGGQDGEDPDAGLDPDSADNPTGDPLQDLQKKVQLEKLYDSVEEIESQCRELKAAAEAILERGQDKAARETASKVATVMKEAERQCGIVRANMADLGADNSRAVYDSVRERVRLAADALKHVIDDDDHFGGDAHPGDQHPNSV